MKKIQDLTKSELISLVLNQLSTVGCQEECLECASCGETPDA